MSRNAEYGIDRGGFRGIAERSNRDVVLIGQIESVHAVENIDESAQSRPGLDGLIVGRADLATSIGHMGQSGHPEVIELTQKVTERLAILDRARFGLAVYSSAEISDWSQRGSTLFVQSADVFILVQRYKELVDEFRDGAAG
jgi:2-keto-3-deoxy-L-rhamnonate aldolase RhmA